VDIAIFGGLVVLLVTLRHLAARQVAAGNGRAVWIVFLPVVIAAAALVVIAAQVLLRCARCRPGVSHIRPEGIGLAASSSVPALLE
jgi:hypothetical protein